MEQEINPVYCAIMPTACTGVLPITTECRREIASRFFHCFPDLLQRQCSQGEAILSSGLSEFPIEQSVNLLCDPMTEVVHFVKRKESDPVERRQATKWRHVQNTVFLPRHEDQLLLEIWSYDTTEVPGPRKGSFQANVSQHCLGRESICHAVNHGGVRPFVVQIRQPNMDMCPEWYIRLATAGISPVAANRWTRAVKLSVPFLTTSPLVLKVWRSSMIGSRKLRMFCIFFGPGIMQTCIIFSCRYLAKTE